MNVIKGDTPPKKIVVKLIPRGKVVSDCLTKARFNPFLQLTLPFSKPISSVVSHISKKWSIINQPNQEFGSGVFRIFPTGNISHSGWGTEDKGVTTLTIYQLLQCPTNFILEYDCIVKPKPLPQVISSLNTLGKSNVYNPLYIPTTVDLPPINQLVTPVNTLMLPVHISLAPSLAKPKINFNNEINSTVKENLTESIKKSNKEKKS